MDKTEIIKRQRNERQQCLDDILKSSAPKKLIVAGAGTGKTFTFGQLLKKKVGGNNLAMTFIRRLVGDMGAELCDCAEIKTFHAYCKKILHERNGSVELIPYLTKIIEKDSEILEEGLNNFDTKFRTLDEKSTEVDFYLRRGDYYEVVGFDDSVYRLYKLLQKNHAILPSFTQIVIDEFQDFNLLEVAFIEELRKKGPILIVGDDDQAVYDGRSASPVHLRDLYKSGEFTVFELPFCSRCPEVIVNTTNAVIKRAHVLGHLQGRINKRYECYIEAKEKDSIKYPKVIVSRCSTSKVIPKYIENEIAKIDADDIAESHKKGKEYPTVLIVGQRQYLREVEKKLRIKYPTLLYSPSIEVEYGLIEAYKQLLTNEKSNLGWRILMEIDLDRQEQKEILAASLKGSAMVDLLDPDYIATHLKAIGIIREIKNKEPLSPAAKKTLRSVVGQNFDSLINYFNKSEEETLPEVDIIKPSILLTSFVGCKGLSAGHVFIIGANNGSIPKNADCIEDLEISQFIVALTRARKQCHIVSNQWLISPKDSKGKWQQQYEKSYFVTWIPPELIEDRGDFKASDFKRIVLSKS
ncbi:MAG: ATP-dependent helicase [Nitrospirae bacterium]|nr:ATP-dependent helicase [Nitrospirota bacterium]